MYLRTAFSLVALAFLAVSSGTLEAKSPAAGRGTRLPAGHPEAFIEAFANTYVNFADTVRAAIDGTEPDPLALDFPDVDDGLRGMLFLETLVASAGSSEKWTPFGT